MTGWVSAAQKSSGVRYRGLKPEEEASSCFTTFMDARPWPSPRYYVNSERGGSRSFTWSRPVRRSPKQLLILHNGDRSAKSIRLRWQRFNLMRRALLIRIRLTSIRPPPDRPTRLNAQPRLVITDEQNPSAWQGRGGPNPGKTRAGIGRARTMQTAAVVLLSVRRLAGVNADASPAEGRSDRMAPRA